MIFDDEIELLGRLLSTKAYIVGGCVRNRLLGLDVSDVDVASAALPKEVIEKASPAFSGVLVNERLGTVKLTSKNSGAVFTKAKPASPAVIRRLLTISNFTLFILSDSTPQKGRQNREVIENSPTITPASWAVRPMPSLCR